MNLRTLPLRVFEGLVTILVCYVFAAVVYTTNYFFLSPVQYHLLGFVDYPRQLAYKKSLEIVYPKFTNWTQYLHQKAISTSAKANSISNSDDLYTMPDSLFMSKSFSSSFTPSEIIPYYYRATVTPDSQDITITTLITSNRFQVFVRLVERYQGPISVTMHIKNVTSQVQETLDALQTLYSSSPHMSRFVDIHLVIDSFDRQFNTWRNIARLFARTDYVMMLDVDFYLCTNFWTAMKQSKPIMQKLREGYAAFVIPAFEYTLHEDGADYTSFPRDKEGLLSLVRSKRVDTFHAIWPGGHNSTDYPRYYTAELGEVYKVMQYQSAYEPYVVFKAEGPPWCDERFVGYGGNKAACLYEMYLSGINFFVLADHFLIHQNHPYQEVIRRNERKFNRRIYSDFKEEACLRYLKAYHDAKILNSTRGYNAQEECKQLKGMARTVAQLIET